MVFLDFLGIKHALFNFFYNLLVKGPLYLVKGINDVINYLSSNKLIMTILHLNLNHFSIPPKYTIFICVGVLILFCIAIFSILKSVLAGNSHTTVNLIFKNLLTIIVCLGIIPILFWLGLFITSYLNCLLLAQTGNGQKMADFIGSQGFINHSINPHWHFQQSPWQYDNNYNLFTAGLGSIFCFVIFIILAISLIQRIFEIFALYLISPLVFSSEIASATWTRTSVWRNILITRLMLTSGIILSLNTFFTIEPLLLSIISKNTKQSERIIFSIVIMLGGAISALHIPNLFTMIAGQTTSLNNGIRQIKSNISEPIKILKIGTLGYFGIRHHRNLLSKVNSNEK